jgi:hypothetical protein
MTSVPVQVESSEDKSDPRIFWIAATCILALIGGALSFHSSLGFFRRNVFYSRDTVFDSDPDRYFQHFLGILPLSRRHPLFTLFIFPLESAAGLAQTALHLPFRQWAAILWGPVAGAIETVLLMMTMRQLRFPLWWAALIACADIASFARLSVGSLPESFGLTSALFALLLLLSAQALSGIPLQPWRWVVCGVLLCGTTVTNIAPWWLVLCSTLFLMGGVQKAAVKRSLSIGAATVLATAVLYVFMLAVFHETWGMKLSVAPAQRNYTAFAFLRFSPGLVAQMAHKVDAYAFTGPLPAVRDNDWKGTFPGQQIPVAEVIMPPLDSWLWAPPLLLVDALLVLGIMGWFGGMARPLGVPALLIITFQLGLHCFWGGGELMLYVLHWQTALLVLIAGGWQNPGWIRTTSAFCLAALVALEVILNFRNVSFMLHVLQKQFVP